MSRVCDFCLAASDPNAEEARARWTANAANRPLFLCEPHHAEVQSIIRKAHEPV